MSNLDQITGAAIESALQIHRDLGPGLLESVYEAVLARALERRGFAVERQKPIAFQYDGMAFSEAFRIDLLIESKVVVELKSVEHLAPVHGKQLLTYLRLMSLPVGLLINFGENTLKEGLHRIVNKLPPASSPALRVNQATPDSRGDAERELRKNGARNSSASPRLRVNLPFWRSPLTGFAVNAGFEEIRTKPTCVSPHVAQPRPASAWNHS